MRRVALQMLADAITIMKKIENVSVEALADSAPSIRL